MERRPVFHGNLAALATKRKQLLAIRQVQYQRNYQEKSLLEELFQQNEDMFLLLHNLLQDTTANLKNFVHAEVASVKDAERASVSGTSDLKRYVREEISKMQDAERFAVAELKRYVREEISSVKDAERVATADLKRFVCEEISKAKLVERPISIPTAAATPTPIRVPLIPLKELSPFTAERLQERPRSRTENNAHVRPRILASSFASSPKRNSNIDNNNCERPQSLELTKRGDGDESPGAKSTSISKAQDPRKRRPIFESKIPFESEDPPLPPLPEEEDEESDGNGDNYHDHNMSDSDIGNMVTQPPSTSSAVVKQEANLENMEEPYDELANGPRDIPPNSRNGSRTSAGNRTRRVKSISKDSPGSGSEGRLKKKRRRKRPRLSLLELQPEPALEKSIENDNDDDDDNNNNEDVQGVIVKEEDASIRNTPEHPKRNKESITIPESPSPERPKRNTESISIPETPSPERPRRNQESICIPETPTPEPSTLKKKKKKSVYIPEASESPPKLPISKKKQAANRRKALPPKTPVTITTAANGHGNGTGNANRMQSSVKFKRTAPSPRGLVFEGFKTPEDVHREVRRKATEQKRREMGYAAKETVLGNARQALQGYECHECAKWFDAEAAGDENPEERKKQLLKHCKHRARKPPPPTPDDYWKLSFDETMTQPPPQ